MSLLATLLGKRTDQTERIILATTDEDTGESFVFFDAELTPAHAQKLRGMIHEIKKRAAAREDQS